MMEHIFQTIAVVAYLICAFSMVCFKRNGDYHQGYALLASALIASFLGQTVHILWFKDPVTVWDAIFAAFLAYLIFRAKGSVAKLIWSSTA